MEISSIGWIHTILGTLAIFLALFIIVTQGYIKSTNNLGKFYIIATLITASTALMLYKNGGFNLAHILAILTLVAIFLGISSEKYNIFGFSKYVQAMSYTGSILFHLLPGIAEVNKRLPINNPMGLSVLDPINIRYYLIFTVIIGLTIMIQWYFIRKKRIMS
ncbi:MAG: hypothetical protein CBC72_002100 [Gammaproteobacteria bacterium TMED112]|nr:MAG: hypothetical protein CBC72_002100 [Gammaproteobacteria bacterium TMED112]|tara:strand:+ start:1936 stop:2421 length:486 start_codon:yes stop_codon:yes gene_type:complete